MNIGYIIAFFAMCCYALLVPMAKTLTLSGLASAHLILINSVILTILALIYLSFSSYEFEPIQKMSVTTIGLVVLWSTTNFLGFILYLYAINKIPATEYQIMYLASPIIVAIVSYLFLSESLHFKHLIGGVLVALGVYIAIKKWRLLNSCNL